MSALAARTLVGTSRVLPAYVISTLVMLQRAADLLTDVESGVVLCLFRVRVLMCAPFLSQCIAVPVAAAVSGIVALGQGRVRTKTVKKSARVIIEKYYSRLTLDFQTNKRICDEVAIIPSKRLRNKIAGFVTHLMARIQKGPVRGISLKLQEEERERRMDFVPEVSAVDTGIIEIDADTKKMLEALGMGNLPHVVVQTTPVEVRGRAPGGVTGYGRDRR